MQHFSDGSGTSPRKNIGLLRPNDEKMQQNSCFVASSDVPRTRKKRPKKPLPEYLTREELGRFFSRIDSPMHLALFRVMYHFGLRAHEPGKLDMRDFRESRVGTPKLRVHRGKGSDDGEIRPPDECLKSLRAWVKQRGQGEGPLFPSQRGRGISRFQVWRLFAHYCQLAAIDPEKRHPHVLKHSCCTHMLERGEPITDVQAHVGHRNIQNTMVYTRITAPLLEAREKRMRDWR